MPRTAFTPAIAFLTLGSALTLTLAACSDANPSGTNADVAIDTIGDTIVVRTLSGSVWGGVATLVPEASIGELEGPEEYLFGSISSIAVDDERSVYVLDGQAQHVRVFDSDGTYVRTLGGPGEGPTEFTRAEAIALLPDGRLVVRDAGIKQIKVFGAGPDEVDQWPYSTSGTMRYSSTPLYRRARPDIPDRSRRVDSPGRPRPRSDHRARAGRDASGHDSRPVGRLQRTNGRIGKNELPRALLAVRALGGRPRRPPRLRLLGRLPSRPGPPISEPSTRRTGTPADRHPCSTVTWSGQPRGMSWAFRGWCDSGSKWEKHPRVDC